MSVEPAEPDLARLSRIADSVFAVVLTLLAYRVRLPAREALLAPTREALAPFFSDLAALGLSVLVASLFWLMHWRVFRLMRRADVGVVVSHLAFLGAMVLLPLSTRLMSAAYGSRVGAFAYSANLLLLALTQTVFRLRARRLEPERLGPLPLLLTPSLLAALFGLALLCSLFMPTLAQALWSVALLMPAVERRWGLGRALAEAPPPR